MKNKTNKEVIEEFRKRFELHDLGKDELTLCCNNSDGTCDGGISIAKENENEVKRHLKKVEKFILQALEQKEREVEPCPEVCCVQRREYGFNNKLLSNNQSKGGEENG